MARKSWTPPLLNTDGPTAPNSCWREVVLWKKQRITVARILLPVTLTEDAAEARRLAKLFQLAPDIFRVLEKLAAQDRPPEDVDRLSRAALDLLSIIRG